MASLLIVDDEEAISWSLKKAFERLGHTVSVASNAEAAFVAAKKRTPDTIILDVRLPGMDGLTAFRQLQDISDSAPVIVITAHGNLATAVKAVEQGAFDYLAKPFDLSQIVETVDRALKSRGPTEAPSTTTGASNSEEIVGQSLAMQGVFKRIALVAPTDACVLITGESGSGKELVARAVHRHSSRSAKPFLPIHIAAMNANLVESELFGHVKGAFTGADKAKPGLLALADGGTAFLDELGDIPLPIQAKLLRVLERQEVIPVGGSFPVKINVRILAATHADLLTEVNAGRFRHDLYFRLNVFEIRLPALGDRTDDLPSLAAHFLREFGSMSPIPDEVIAFLRSRPWPGNVRELRNAIEHAAIIARGSPLRPEHFPVATGFNAEPREADRLSNAIRDWARDHAASAENNLYDRMLERIEPILLDEVLKQTNNNRVAAAKKLGLARATLRKLIAKYHGSMEGPVDDSEMVAEGDEGG